VGKRLFACIAVSTVPRGQTIKLFAHPTRLLERKLANSVPVVLVDDPEMPDLKNTALVRKYLKNTLQGEKFTNLQTKNEITIFSSGIEATLKNRNTQSRRLFAILPQMIGKSIYAGYNENTKKDKKPHIRGYEAYYSAVEIDGKIRTVKILVDVVEDEARGRGYYYHQITDIILDDPVGKSQSQSDNSQTNYSESSKNITITTGGDLPHDDKTIAQTQDDGNKLEQFFSIPDDYEQDIFIEVSRMVKVLGSATTAYLNPNDIADTVASEYEQSSETKSKVSDSDFAKLKESAVQYIKKSADAERANMFGGKPILDDTTTMQTSIQTLKSQFPANNGMGKIALAKVIIQARVVEKNPNITKMVSAVLSINGAVLKKENDVVEFSYGDRIASIGFSDGSFVVFWKAGFSTQNTSFYDNPNDAINEFARIFSINIPNRKNNAPSTNEILERNSQTSRNANSGNEKPVRNDGSANGTNASTPSATANQAGNQQQGDNRVPTDSPVIAGTQGDSSVVKGDGDYSPSRTVDDTGSGDVSGSGISDDRQRNETVAGIAQGTKKLDRAVKLALQAQAEGIDYEPTEENIRATLPFLLPEQQDDIVKIEARFKDNHGMLITNGTGTGKTFTALGAVKRFQKQGKDSILIVVPNDKIGQDFIDSAVNMKLTIKLLDGIKDNGGSGISITTYANFYQNESLLEREFDLVVFDESHKINSNAAGFVHTEKHRAFTSHLSLTLPYQSLSQACFSFCSTQLSTIASISATAFNTPCVGEIDCLAYCANDFISSAYFEYKTTFSRFANFFAVACFAGNGAGAKRERCN
jgi:hypothetical protein